MNALQAVTPPRPEPQRLTELDALRGVMLLWITVTHLPTRLSTYVNQPFGYFAATEGFIFLSALFTGRIYGRVAERQGESAMSRRLWMRAARLYGYQLLLLLVAFVIEAPLAAHGNRPAVKNLLSFYFTGHARAYLEAALMIYRPPLLDILPIYIIFMALTPFALMLGARWGWKYLFSASGVLWFFAQFGFRSFAHRLVTRALALHIPLNEMGAFDLWAWQLWWLVGLYLGVRWARGDLRFDLWARRLMLPAALVALSFLALRYAQMGGMVSLGKFDLLLDKWTFGAGRIVDFTAVAVLAVHFRGFLKHLAVQPLVLLGQASLEVFCVHLMCVFFALTVMGSRPQIRGPAALVLVAASCAALFLTATLVTRRRARANRAGALPAVPAQHPPESHLTQSPARRPAGNVTS
ncbi:MAG TPA: OpgC domain-containing protein [Anaeromyxobacteraceae bacterium]|nr:OpgC domain-containing protein [Anaeromyxobacteraceae bacterium]